MADLMVSLIKYAEATVSQNPVRATEILGEFNVGLRELEAKAARVSELEAKAKRCDAYEAVDVDCVSCEDKRAYIDGVFICPRCFIETQENKAKAAAFDNLRKRGTDWD